jgi:DNA invertase Pin-like site-specific DNA recombinase
VTPTNIRIGAYIRVSTLDQNPEMQVSELRQWSQRHGYPAPIEYVDEGISGTRASRPALNAMLADVRAGRIQMVITWKLDRLFRSLAHLVQTIQELNALHVRFVAITQGIDTDQNNPMATLLLHLLAAFGQFEREMIRERVTAGVRNAKRKGVQLGRRRVVFDRSRAMEMHEAGTSIKNIATTLGVSVGTIHRAITTFKNPAATALPQVDDSAVLVPGGFVLQQSEECGMSTDVSSGRTGHYNVP